MNIQNMIDAMSLDEKIKIISGKSFWYTHDIKRLNIPAVLLSDGPHGLRKQFNGKDHMGIGSSLPAVSFPTAVNMASSWNTELIEEIGQALGTHCVHEKIAVLLGPGINIKRSPLCGRNFEYFSEDPYISGRIAAAWIKGVQSCGVGASIKHYALNNQETRRMTINVLVDERAMYEIYLSAFEEAVKDEQPYTVMSAYNMVNGQYASENKSLIDSILRKKWGFKGLVVSDWGAVNNRVDGLIAGLDLEMPCSYGAHKKGIKKAIKKGYLTTAILDKSVTRILELVDRVQNQKCCIPFDIEEQHQLARKAAAESIVLLKNKQKTLPLSIDRNFVLIGALAKEMRYQGAGSSRVNPTKLPNLVDTLKERNISFDYAQGYSLCEEDKRQNYLEEAITKAKNHKTVVVVAGLTEDFESEGFDREHINLPPSQNRLIKELSLLNKKIIVILFGGGPVAMPWITKIDALLNAYLPGQAGAEAITDIIFGDANPSGKLAETYPLALEDTPCFNSFACEKYHQPYLESIYVGYRYYDKAKKRVLFPFGYGLSYTKFAYLKMTLSSRKITDQDILEVSVTVSNTGMVSGKETVQIYTGMVKSNIFREVKKLRDFKKIHLEPGQERKVIFRLRKRDFAYYNFLSKNYKVESGKYMIMAGSSSRHIHLYETIFIKSVNEDTCIPKAYSEIDDYFFLNRKKHTFNLDSFKKLYTNPFPKENDHKDITINTPVYDMRHHFLGRVIYRIMEKQVIRMTKDDTGIALMIERSLKELPLRSIVLMGQGKISLVMAQGIVDLVNRKYIIGLYRFIAGLLIK